MQQTRQALRKWQIRILGTLWFTYALMYFGRVNMAVALPLIEKQFGLDKFNLGLLNSCFFWVYAFGQFANGILGDRFSTRRFVFIGLLGTGLMNLCFGASSSFTGLVLIWACNGVFQSMGWGPLLKTAAHWTSEAEQNKASSFLNTSFVLGSLLSWYILGSVLDVHPRWELAFYIPAAALFLQAILWYLLVRDHPRQVGLPQPKKKMAGRQTFKEYLGETLAFLHQPSFLLLAFTTAILGMIKNGILLWTPALLLQSFQLSVRTTTIYALLIPLFSLLGILLAVFIDHHFQGNNVRTVAVLFFLGALLALGFRSKFVGRSIFLCSTLVGLCSTITYGIGVVLFSFIPLRFAPIGKTSTLAGFLDFAAYVGSGVSTVITGLLIKTWGWGALFWSWVFLFTVGALSMLPSLLQKAGADLFGSLD
jgi:sugar phosphate permease